MLLQLDKKIIWISSPFGDFPEPQERCTQSTELPLDQQKSDVPTIDWNSTNFMQNPFKKIMASLSSVNNGSCTLDHILPMYKNDLKRKSD